MVGLVIVSHSAALAGGVAELAREMGGPEVRIELAGGIDAPDPALGTDAVRVAEAIERADAGDGVLVLMDLGSAVLSAETALDLLAPERRERVLLSEAPLVEGAVAAAVTAKLGAPLADVAAEARGALVPKASHLGAGDGPIEAPGMDAGEAEVRLAVRNRLGLHARPAARLVQTLARFDADVTVENVTGGRGPASGRSVNALATLGVREGHEVVVRARGPQADEALAAVSALARRAFDEATAAAPPELARAVAAPGRGELAGLRGAPGSALGPARRFHVPDPDIPTEPGGDPEAEWEALRRALERTRAELREARASVAARAGEYSAGIFDAHLLFLDDEALLEPARRAIDRQGASAARAWRDAVEAVAGDYRGLDDDYLRARADDVVAVGRRVLAHLAGVAPPAPIVAGAGILVAPDLTPAETAALDPAVVRGIATAYGGPTSHSAILARSLGIPAVVGVGESLLAVGEGTPLLVDGDAGTVVVAPDAAAAAAHEGRRRARSRAGRAARAAAQEPARTRDGRRIEVAANVGSAADVEQALAHGADGVGLLRTEFLFLGRDALPDEDAQAAAYRDIAARLDGRPLVLRTLDVGADKPLPALPRPAEPNPFLGVRGIRLGLAEPELLSVQLRAALRAAADHPLKVMFPLVATVEEVRAARALLEAARERLAASGTAAGDVEVGVMVEVPAAALAADALAREVDFFSLGTNDLAQYTLAADRGNERVAALADALHPAVLRLVQATAEAAAAHARPVAVCGEVASDALAAPLLIGLGAIELSASPPAIPAVKEAVRRTETASARELAAEALALESAAAVRALLASAGRETALAR